MSLGQFTAPAIERAGQLATGLPLASLAGKSVRECVFRAIYTTRNAELQLRAMTIGKLDPLSPVAFESYGLALGIAKRDIQAQAAVRHALDLDSTLIVSRMMSGAVQLYANRVADAIRQLEPALKLDSGNAFVLGVLGYAYGKVGRTADARSIVRRLGSGITNQNSAAETNNSPVVISSAARDPAAGGSATWWSSWPP